MWKSLMAGCLLAALATGGTVFAQERTVYSPTTLIEDSEALRADWHRVMGKIEGALPDKKAAETVQEKMATWLEGAGTGVPMTFEEAQRDLAGKFRRVEESLDAARSNGKLAEWVPGAAAPAPVPARNFAASSTAAPQAAAVGLPAPAPAPTASVPVDRLPGGSAPVNAAAGWLTLAITAFGGALGFFVYPVLFQPSSDQYFRSALQRLNKRIGVTAVFMFFSFLIGSGVAGALFGK